MLIAQPFTCHLCSMPSNTLHLCSTGLAAWVLPARTCTLDSCHPPSQQMFSNSTSSNDSYACQTSISFYVRSQHCAPANCSDFPLADLTRCTYLMWVIGVEADVCIICAKSLTWGCNGFQPLMILQKACMKAASIKTRVSGQVSFFFCVSSPAWLTWTVA